jgi:hypothetical protein
VGNLPAQSVQGFALASGYDLEDLGGKVFADAWYGIEGRPGFFAGIGTFTHQIGDLLTMTADALRGTLIGADAEGIFVLQGEKLRHLVEDSGDFFVVHGHIRRPRCFTPALPGVPRTVGQ